MSSTQYRKRIHQEGLLQSAGRSQKRMQHKSNRGRLRRNSLPRPAQQCRSCQRMQSELVRESVKFGEGSQGRSHKGRRRRRELERMQNLRILDESVQGLETGRVRLSERVKLKVSELGS